MSSDQIRKNKTIVIINKDLIRKLPNPPEYIIDKFVDSLKKTYS